MSQRATPGRWIGRGWEIFKEDVGNFILVALISVALMSVATILVAGPLFAGMFLVVRRRILEGRTDFMDLFAGFNRFIDAFLVCLLTTVFEIFGLLLCIFPVLIVMAFYLFPYLFIVDRKLAFWDAMESSRKVVLQDLVGYVVFVVLLLLLNLLGLLLFGIGVLVTIPITVAAIAVAYQETVGFLHKAPEPSGPVRIG